MHPPTRRTAAVLAALARASFVAAEAKAAQDIAQRNNAGARK